MCTMARGRVRTTTTTTAVESRNMAAINYLITESEVVTGKSQTEALPY